MGEQGDSCVQELAAYHVVTSRPMEVGQRIRFDRTHPNGVFHRVKEKEEDVRQIKAHPEEWRGKELPHHTMVALRELALEEVRVARFPDLPSRLHCLYVSGQREQAEKYWAVAPDPTGEMPIWEELVDGDITVTEILWEKQKERK